MEIKICDNCGGHTGPAIKQPYDKVVKSIETIQGLDLCHTCAEEYKKECEQLQSQLSKKFSMYNLKVKGLGFLL